MAEERELNPELTTDTMTDVQQESDITEDSIVQPEEEQLRPQRRKKRKKKHYLLKFFILIIIVGAAFLVMSSSRFDITEIKVEGNVNIAAETAIEDSGIKTGDNIFFMNKRQIVKKMQEKSPLYGDVTIDRQLPGTLTINVAERTAAMTLPYGEKYVVLDAQGIVIGLVDSQPQVTEIKGITIKKMDSGEEVEPKEAEIYQQSVEIIQKANAAICYNTGEDITRAQAKKAKSMFFLGTFDFQADEIESVSTSLAGLRNLTWAGITHKSKDEFMQYFNQDEYLEELRKFNNGETKKRPSPMLRCQFCKDLGINFYYPEFLYIEFADNIIEAKELVRNVIKDEFLYDVVDFTLEKQKIRSCFDFIR